MRPKKRLLFLRRFRRPTGGNIKLRDYFLHAAAHERVEARIWFAPGSQQEEGELWRGLRPEQRADGPDPAGYDLVCINGKDWELLEDSGGGADIVHFVQHPGFATDPGLKSYLARKAWRMFTTKALQDLLTPLCNGPGAVVPIGVDPAFLGVAGGDKSVAVTILAGKQPEFAAALAARLADHGVDAVRLDGSWRPHDAYVAAVGASAVLVTLPNAVEGFYLPALEGMAAGCAIICGDVRYNRGHCIAGETCLMPPLGDLDGHVDAVLLLLRDEELRTRLVAGGAAMARGHAMADERAAFHHMLDAAFADQDARRSA